MQTNLIGDFFVLKNLINNFFLTKKREIDWYRANEYYRKIIGNCSEEKGLDDGFYDISAECEPVYTILARIGEMFMEGKHGIEQNYAEAADLFNEAAERAMQSGKGRLANKYYGLAEKANALSDP